MNDDIEIWFEVNHGGRCLHREDDGLDHVMTIELNLMSNVNQSKTAPEQSQSSGVKIMSDVPKFGVAIGVVLTATHSPPVMSELY